MTKAREPDCERLLFHEGELDLQLRAGVRERVEGFARRALRSRLPDEHRQFYAQLPFAVLGARDGEGRPWATLLCGAPGFLSSPSPEWLSVRALPGSGDALEGALASAADVGLLGIEPHSRRRNRVNGVVERLGEEGFLLSVRQSFGNCPKYITRRELRFRQAPRPRAPSARVGRLDEPLAEMVRRADTLFIATGYGRASRAPSEGNDVSHRGGAPGFVDLVDDRTLVLPDYVGNNLFNTLGNLTCDPRAGICIPDFGGGSLLQLTGTATLDWDSPRVSRYAGARRLLEFRLEEARLVQGALALCVAGDGGWGPTAGG